MSTTPARPTPARIGIVTVSDRASRGEYEDRGGPAIREYLDEVLTSSWEPVTRVVPDEGDVLTRMCTDVERAVTPEEAAADVAWLLREALRDEALPSGRFWRARAPIEF